MQKNEYKPNSVVSDKIFLHCWLQSDEKGWKPSSYFDVNLWMLRTKD